MATKKRAKKTRKKHIVRHILIKTDRQRKNAYKRVINSELSEMSTHQLFLTRQAVAKIRWSDK